MSRVGLGRHGQLDSDAGDPLDGLVNLFDLGIVLSIAFLLAALSSLHLGGTITRTGLHASTTKVMMKRMNPSASSEAVNNPGSASAN